MTLLLLKYDGSGNLLWARTAGGTGDDYGISVQQALEWRYIVAGETSSYGAGGTDIFLLKTDANGLISGCSDIASITPITSSPILTVSLHRTVSIPSIVIGSPSLSARSGYSDSDSHLWFHRDADAHTYSKPHIHAGRHAHSHKGRQRTRKAPFFTNYTNRDAYPNEIARLLCRRTSNGILQP